MRLASKTIVVTGGTSGIGAAIVDHCIGLGGQVVFTGRRAEAGRQLEITQRRRDGACRFHAGDVTAPGFASELVRGCHGDRRVPQHSR